jgi:hypothetical protein
MGSAELKARNWRELKKVEQPKKAAHKSSILLILRPMKSQTANAHTEQALSPH